MALILEPSRLFQVWMIVSIVLILFIVGLYRATDKTFPRRNEVVGIIFISFGWPIAIPILIILGPYIVNLQAKIELARAFEIRREKAGKNNDPRYH